MVRTPGSETKQQAMTWRVWAFVRTLVYGKERAASHLKGLVENTVGLG